VIYATDRDARPSSFQHDKRVHPKTSDQADHDPACPFCTGNEHLTPNPLYVAPGGMMPLSDAAPLRGDMLAGNGNVLSSLGGGWGVCRGRQRLVDARGAQQVPRGHPRRNQGTRYTAVRYSAAPAPCAQRVRWHGFMQISDRDKSVFSDAIALNNQYPATGHHEVLIETNHHNLCTARTNEQHVRRVAWAWRERGNGDAAGH
jgi:galactose-1-phosphate uridylyltransferase